MQIFINLIWLVMVMVVLLNINLGILADGQTNQNRHYRGVNRSNNSAGTQHNNIGIRNDAYDRINEKISFVAAQELEKLDVLDTKISKLESINSESTNSIRSDLRNLDWKTSQTDQRLEQLRTDIEQMSRNMENTAHTLLQRQIPRDFTRTDSSSSSTISPPTDSADDKLEAIAILLRSTRLAILSAETTLDRIGQNITNLLKLSSDIKQNQQFQLTKQILNNVIQQSTIRNPPQSTVYTLVHPQQSPTTTTSNINGEFLNTRNQQSQNIPISCSHIDDFTQPKNGIYKIRVNSVTSQSTYVWCDMDTDGGGWTVIQRRIDGTINFNRNWLEYKLGFGNFAGEYFIGLEKLHQMTTTLLHELAIVMEDFNGTSRIAKYNSFAIGNEEQDYVLNLLGNYEGTAGDGLSYSAGHKFSTFDNDNDGWIEGNCAQAHTGAWWYNACEMSNLNGKYLQGNVGPENLFQGMYWNDFHGPIYSLKSVKMLIRPIDRIFNPDMTVSRR